MSPFFRTIPLCVLLAVAAGLAAPPSQAQTARAHLAQARDGMRQPLAGMSRQQGFRDRPEPYEYRGTGRAGPEKVARMKALAEAGRGLATYISRYAHDDFER